MRGDRDEAIALLREASDSDYRQSNMWIRDDPALASLHGDPEFEAIVEEMRRRNEDPAPTGRATSNE